MSRLEHKKHTEAMRRKRVRASIHGTQDKPRLSINISNQHVTAQIIDDDSKSTLVYVSTVGIKTSGTLTERAATVGKEVAKKAKAAKIKKVIFDRGDKLYHGRVKALADAAREEGLEF